MATNILKISAIQSTIETYQLLFEWITGIPLTEQEFYFDFRASNNKIILRKRIMSFSSAQSQTGSPFQPSSSGSYSPLPFSAPRYHFVPRDSSGFLHYASSGELLRPFIFWQKYRETWSFFSFVSIRQISHFGLPNRSSTYSFFNLVSIPFLPKHFLMIILLQSLILQISVCFCNPSVLGGEDISCLRSRYHCDWPSRNKRLKFTILQGLWSNFNSWNLVCISFPCI
jgi:hypothetical protein